MNTEIVEHQTFMTKDEFLEQSLGMMMVQGGPELYIEANAVFVSVLEQILSKTSSFEELKNQLLEICKERKQFIDFANLNLP